MLIGVGNYLVMQFNNTLAQLCFENESEVHFTLKMLSYFFFLIENK